MTSHVKRGLSHICVRAWSFVLVGCIWIQPSQASDGLQNPPVSREVLADAVEVRDESRFQELLKAGGDLNQAQPDGTTALLWAVYHDLTDWAGPLIDAGVDVNRANRYGVTPLSIACQNGNARMVQQLLEAGADPQKPFTGGETPLMTAALTGIAPVVHQLIQAGVPLDSQERKGQTALMWAAAAGNTGVVRMLVQAGADWTRPLPSGFTPFFFAIREGHRDIVRLFIEQGADVRASMHATRSGGSLPRKGTTPLILAIENGHFELAVDLLEAGANPNDSSTGYTPLHTMTWVRKPNRGEGEDGAPPPIVTGPISSLDFIRKLIQSGADPNARLERGSSGGGQLSLKGATPFLMACRTADLEYLKLLYESGADPHLPNSDNATPVMAAAGLGTLAPGETAGTEPEALEVLDFLLSLKADLNHTDDNGETAMHGAAYKCFPEVVRLLHKNGASLSVWNKKNKYGWTPLLIAEGWRPGNYRPSFETMDALHEIMIASGMQPPPRTTSDPNGPRLGYEAP